jgi:hypothetical protein
MRGLFCHRIPTTVYIHGVNLTTTVYIHGVNLTTTASKVDTTINAVRLGTLAHGCVYITICAVPRAQLPAATPPRRQASWL